MSSDLSPLKLVTTEALVKELQERSDACIVAYERYEEKTHHFFSYFHGGVSTSIGLAARLQQRLLAHYDRDETEMNE